MATYEDRIGGHEVVQFQPARLPYHDRIKESFGVDRASWKALTEAVFPLAKSVDSVVLALSYCKARNLDPFKRVVHIVPMWDSAKRGMVETIWPSIAELRITAHRTGQYAGCDETEFGPEKTQTFKGKIKSGDKWDDVAKTVTFPEWAKVTVYRNVNGVLCKFAGPRVKWLESFATIGRSEVPNDMWGDRPEGQLEKCAEAAALRKAFPEEIGNTYAAEEMQGRKLITDVTATEVVPSEPVAKRREKPTLQDIADGKLRRRPAPDLDPSVAPFEADREPAADEADRTADAPAAGNASMENFKKSPVADAYKKGAAAHANDLTIKAMPQEYKGNKALVAAWKQGWTEAQEADTEEAEDETED